MSDITSHHDVTNTITGIIFRFSIWWYPELMQDPVFFINNFIYLLPPVSVGMYLSYKAISFLYPSYYSVQLTILVFSLISI